MEEIREKIRRKYPFLWDEKWRKELHKAWFWGGFNEQLLIWDNGEIEYMPGNTYFREEPDNLLAVIRCPGWNNLDTSDYEENVGVWDGNAWRWDENFLEDYPEYAKNPKPKWEDIINASIDAGEWSEFEDELVEEILNQAIEKEKQRLEKQKRSKRSNMKRTTTFHP